MWSVGRGFKIPGCSAVCLEPRTSCSRASASVTKKYNLVPALRVVCYVAGKETICDHTGHASQYSSRPINGDEPPPHIPLYLCILNPDCQPKEAELCQYACSAFFLLRVYARSLFASMLVKVIIGPSSRSLSKVNLFFSIAY